MFTSRNRLGTTLRTARASARRLGRQTGAALVLATTCGIALAAPQATDAHRASPLAAQADSARALTERGFITGRIEVLDSSLALLDRALAEGGGDGITRYERGYVLYRIAGLHSLAGRRDEARRALDAADGELERSGRLLPWPETFALRAAVVGQKIGFSSNPLASMRLGPRSNNLMARAESIDPDNPRVVMIRGIGALYKPRLLGGGAERAERDLLRATVLFTNDHPSPPRPAWGHAEAWAFLGLVYTQTKRFTEARDAYAHALSISPAFEWVRAVLLVDLDRLARAQP